MQPIHIDAASTQQFWRRRHPPMLLLAPSLLAIVALCVPIVYLILRASQAGQDSLDFVFRNRTAEVLANTVVLALAVSLTAGVLGVLAAWCTERVELPLARLWPVLMALPLVIPSYVAAFTFIAMFGPRGFLYDTLHSHLDIDSIPVIYGFTGAWLTLSLFTFPYVYLTVRASLIGFDPNVEEAARGLGRPSRDVLLRVTLPLLRPGIVAGVLLSALYTVSDFGVVSLFRFDALTRAIYVQYQSSFDRTQAAVLALILVAFAMVIVLVDARTQRVYFRSGPGVARRTKKDSGIAWRWGGAIYLTAISCITLVVPIGVLLYWLMRAIDRGTVSDHLATASLHSLTMGATGALIAVAIGFCIAMLTARYHSRIGRLAESMAYLGFGLPGIAIALAFVFLGANYLPWLYQTLPLLVAGYVVRFLPQAVGSTKASLMQINPHLEDAARGLGATHGSAVRRVTVPLAAPGLIAGAVMVSLSIMKELPLTLLLSPTGYRTLATEIWTAATVNAYSQAAAPALFLILIAAIPAVALARGAYRSVTLEE